MALLLEGKIASQFDKLERKMAPRLVPQLEGKMAVLLSER